MNPNDPKMMPGQTPYTDAERAALYGLVRDAAEGDPGEQAEPTTKSYSLVVHCRVRGAIGVFYPVAFRVDAPSGASRDAIRDAWFAKYGDDWEMHHIVFVTDPEPLAPR
jgi:hypothetical protein